MQILRPISDVSVTPSGGWAPFPTSPATLYDKIDDGGGVADDGGTISTSGSVFTPFVEEEYVCGITAGGAPGTPGTCTVYITAAKEFGSGVALDLTVEVRETTTLRASHTWTSISDSATTLSFTFSSSLISSWTTLRLYVRRENTVAACFVTVYNLRMEAPDAGFEHLQVTSTVGFIIAAASGGHYIIPDGPGFKRVDGLEVAGALIPAANATGFKVF